MSLRDYFSNNKIFTGTEKPTQGKFGVGDIIVNIGPNSAEEPMWICVEAGTPGVWELCSGVNEEEIADIVQSNALSAIDYTDGVDIQIDGGEIGNMNELQTTDKSSIVGAINELFQSANNGKELIANAIGEPLNAEDTFSAMSTDINSLLSTFKTNMMNSGVTVEANDRFKSLIDKIKGLTEGEGNRGIQFAEGIIKNSVASSYNTTTTYTFNEPLTFEPNFLFLVFETITDSYASGYGVTSHYNNFVVLDYVKHSNSTNPETILVSNITNEGFAITVNFPLRYSGNISYYAIGVGEEDTTLRDSLASILTEEGVSVTEEDDMANLISKVDTEFTKDNNTISELNTSVTLLNNQVNSLTSELVGKVTPVGTAVASNVLTGKTFINSTGNIITGSMANQGAKTFTPSASKQTGAAGYYSSVTCNAVSNLTAANIRSGVTVGGVTGTCVAAPTSMSGSWYHTGFMYRTTTKPQTTTITHNKGNTNYSIVISSYGQMHSSKDSYNYQSSNSFVDGSTTTTTITFNNTVATYTITVTKNANTIDLSFKTTAGYGVDAHIFIGIL